MNRKLASIQIIEKLEPIAGADFIEKVSNKFLLKGGED